MDAKKLKLSEARKAIYLRNKKLAEEFKNGMKCTECGLPFLSCQLAFKEDPKTPNSVAMLILNRASPERLQDAMNKTHLLCLNHHALWLHKKEAL